MKCCVEMTSLKLVRIKAKWIRNNLLTDTLECSSCKYNIIDKSFATPFCPWCGAEMENYDRKLFED